MDYRLLMDITDLTSYHVNSDTSTNGGLQKRRYDEQSRHMIQMMINYGYLMIIKGNFLFLHKNVCCGYSLESPQNCLTDGILPSTHNMFLRKTKQKKFFFNFHQIPTLYVHCKLCMKMVNNEHNNKTWEKGSPLTYKDHGNHFSCDMTKPTKWLCAQQRLRSAWASTQSDQSLHCLLNG